VQKHFGGSMKRQVLISLVMCFGMVSANIYGQEKLQKSHTVYFPSFYNFMHDPGTASLGIGYERIIIGSFAVGAEFIALTNFNDNVSLDFIGNLKYYPIKTKVGNMYADIGLGYRQNRTGDDIFHGLIGTAHIGWKFIFRNGLVIEPGFGVGFFGNEKYEPYFVSRASLGWTF
jgi:hypothetical protein